MLHIRCHGVDTGVTSFVSLTIAPITSTAPFAMEYWQCSLVGDIAAHARVLLKLGAVKLQAGLSLNLFIREAAKRYVRPQSKLTVAMLAKHPRIDTACRIARCHGKRMTEARGVKCGAGADDSCGIAAGEVLNLG